MEDQHILIASAKNMGWVEGLWFAVEMLVNRGSEDFALYMIKETGVPKEEFEKCLERTGYMQEELKEKVLDRWIEN